MQQADQDLHTDPKPSEMRPYSFKVKTWAVRVKGMHLIEYPRLGFTEVKA